MTKSGETGLGRRDFLRVAGAAAALGLVTRLNPLAAGAARADESLGADGYGPLYPTKDHATGLELLLLPRGFEYVSFGWTGDLMDDGRPTPGAHDGMAAFDSGDGLVRLVRNHELRGQGGAFAAGMTYNPVAEGGTTTLTFDPRAGALVGAHPSLAGTLLNCSGGPTPWGSWLSCEETTELLNGYPHGYVFEVPVDGVSSGEPIRGMGRFQHEAAVVDPASGIVYLTEDATPAALYRYVPQRPGDLAAGGALQALKLGGESRVTTEDSSPLEYGPVSWVDIPYPDALPAHLSVVTQAILQGAAIFDRLEGAVFADGKLYFVSTSGGPARGQLFELDPEANRLRLVLHSSSTNGLDSPDNICASPRGGTLLCEDGGGTQLLRGLASGGDVFAFAQNNIVLNGERGFSGDFTSAEWAGATFGPSGEWLFANLYQPGITVAITGPWRNGPL